MTGTARQTMNPKDIAPHEQFRIRMVDVAMKRIARHPNWCRGFGFAVGESWWPGFLESLGAVKDEIGERIGQSLCVTIFNSDSFPFDVTELQQPLA